MHDRVAGRRSTSTLLADRLLVAMPVLAALTAPLWFLAPSRIQLALVLLSAMVLGGAVVWRAPLLAASLLPILLPPPQFAKVFAYELALFAVAGLILLTGIRERRPWVWKLDRIEVAVALLLAWGMASVFWSTSTWWWLFTVRKMVVGLVALWTAWRLARHLRVETLEVGIMAGSIALALATIVKAVGSGLFVPGGGFSRLAGTDFGWGSSNFIAALLVLMLPTTLHLALDSSRQATRVLAWSTLPLSAMVASVAASRGGALLVLLVALLFVARRRFGRQTAWLLLALVAVVALLLLGPGGSGLVERFFAPREQGSVLIRLLFFREGWRRLVDHFPWGMGIGQGLVELDRLGSRGSHNYLLLIGSEMGLPGLLLWGTIVVLMVRRALAFARDPRLRPAAQAMLFTVAVSFLNSQFEGTFEGLQYQFLFYWIMGAYLGRLSRNEAPGMAPVGFVPRAVV